MPAAWARVDGLGPGRRIRATALCPMVGSDDDVYPKILAAAPIHPSLPGLSLSAISLALSPAVAMRSMCSCWAPRAPRDPLAEEAFEDMTESACPFCAPQDDRLFHRGRLIFGLWDQFPVSPGHALIIPRRHVGSWFAATDEERGAMIAGVAEARAAIEQIHQPDGYNLGVNIGHAAGQTISHLHLHVIPRYHGDVTQPRGGVRHVIPEKADYVGMVREAQAVPYAALAASTPPEVPSPSTVRPPHWQALVRVTMIRCYHIS